MMNKSIQPVGMSNAITATAVDAGGRHGKDDEASPSFNEVLAASPAVPADGESRPQSAAEGDEGNPSNAEHPQQSKVPAEQAATAEQASDTEGVAAAEVPMDGDTSPEQLPAVVEEFSPELLIPEEMEAVAPSEADADPAAGNVKISELTAPSVAPVPAAEIEQTAESVKVAAVPQNTRPELPGALPGVAAGNQPVAEQALKAVSSAQLATEAVAAAAERPSTAEISRGLPVVEASISVLRQVINMTAGNGAGIQALNQIIPGAQSLSSDPGVLNPSILTTAVYADTTSDTGLSVSSPRLQVPVGQPGWGRALGEQTMWFVSQNIKVANLRLNPAHLGPLEMNVSIDDDQASVAFVSNNSVVREALESALPRLREMLAENGLNLANVHVSQRGVSDQQGQGASGAGQDGNGQTGDSAVDGEDREHGQNATVSEAMGLVDYYV